MRSSSVVSAQHEQLTTIRFHPKTPPRPPPLDNFEANSTHIVWKYFSMCLDDKDLKKNVTKSAQAKTLVSESSDTSIVTWLR